MDECGIKILYTYAVIIAGFITSVAETFQESFSYAGANIVIQNVTTEASDPGQKLILNLGMSFYQGIFGVSNTIIHIFVFGACLLLILLIWNNEINESLKKIRTIKISFNKETTEKVEEPL
jgi:hypothetical protein